MKNLIILLLPVLFAACSGEKQQPGSNTAVAESRIVSLTPEQVKNSGITTGKPQPDTLNAVLKLNGIVDVPPGNKITVSFPLGGHVKQVSLLPGMPVRKGEVIAVMEDMQYVQLQQEYLTSRSKLHFAEQEYLRQEELNASKASSDKVFQAAKNEYENAKVLAASLAARLKLIGIDPAALNEKNISGAVSIYSPVTGYVSAVHVNTGKYVQPSDVLFELIDPSDIHLSISVFEKEVDKLAAGQKLTAYTNQRPGRKYNAEIMLVSRNLDDEGKAEVHCHFESDQAGLLPGMFMNAEVQTQTAGALTVPVDAVVSWQGRSYLFVEAGNGFEMVEVKTGIQDKDKVELLPEYAQQLSDKKVALSNAYALLMKMKNVTEE